MLKSLNWLMLLCCDKSNIISCSIQVDTEKVPKFCESLNIDSVPTCLIYHKKELKVRQIYNFALFSLYQLTRANTFWDNRTLTTLE